MRKLSLFVVLAALALAHCTPAPPLEGAATPRPLVVSGDAGSPDATTSAKLAELPEGSTVCTLPATKVASRAGARPFTRPDGLCKDETTGKPGSCGFADRYDYPPTPGDTCFVADSNIEAAARAVRSGGSPAPIPRLSGTSSLSSPPPPPAPVPGAPWDRKRAPKYLDKVVSHFGLTGPERTMLERNGFVVLDRKAVHTYVAAYHDVFQEQLPLYVTADSILHAVFKSEDALLEGIERAELKGAVESLVTRLRAALRGMPQSPAAHDVDLYLTIASKLMTDDPSTAPSVLGRVDREAEGIVSQLRAAGAGLVEVDMYGRRRTIDASKLEPAGHYAGYHSDDYADPSKKHLGWASYYQVMTWLSKHEWNLVTRGCQSSTPIGAECTTTETPREAQAALLLAELVERAGVRPTLDRFETVYSTFGGKRDDVPIAKLGALVGRGALLASDGPQRLAAAIGEGWKRTAVTHPMPVFPGDHDGRLPAIATLLGARTPPDLDPVGQVMRAAYPGKLTGSAFGGLLGHDARTWNPSLAATEASALTAGLTLAPKLRAEARAGTSLYDAWMSAVLALGDAPRGIAPSFYESKAHAALRLGSALVGYAQIRHNFVLMSGSSYDSYGCEIPDAYVEPQLPVYEALVTYAERGRALGTRDAATRQFFDRTLAVLRTLVTITKHELEGRALTADERRYLGMITEYEPEGGYGGDSHGPPKRGGWYFDLFTDRGKLAEQSADFVGEIATNAHYRYVLDVGAEMPRLGLFVVDTGGEPRVMVGPVATGYEARPSLQEARWTDESAVSKPHEAPWRALYTAPLAREPSIDGTVVTSCDESTTRAYLRAATRIEGVTAWATDHHGDPASAVANVTLSPTGVTLAFDDEPLPPKPAGDALAFYGGGTPSRTSRYAGLRVHVPAHVEDGVAIDAYDVTLGPSVYHTLTGLDPAYQPTRIPERQAYENLGAFGRGALRVSTKARRAPE
ncbi:MAG: DUF3160 domain-containing protein [Myxococcales bacterium]|nr:DUF3160 domain-containing protein [Myxococcales bacterium]